MSKLMEFKCVHNEGDNRGNVIYYVDGYPKNENEEGEVVATVTLTPHNDIAINWFDNWYITDNDVLEVINDVIDIDIAGVIEDRRENKVGFCKALGSFIKSSTSEFEDIKRLDYYDDGGNEWLYVTYESFSQKRINVNADSGSAIMRDFVNNIGKVDWLRPSEQVSEEELDRFSQSEETVKEDTLDER